MILLVDQLLASIAAVMCTCTSCHPTQCTMYDSSVKGAIQDSFPDRLQNSIFGWCRWINFFAELLSSIDRSKSKGGLLLPQAFMVMCKVTTCFPDWWCQNDTTVWGFDGSFELH